MYPAPEQNSYNYLSQGMDAEQPTIRPFKRRAAEDADADGDEEDIAMQKAPKAKKSRLAAAGFRSSDLAEAATGPSASKAKNEAQRQFEREKERKALDKAKAEGRFIQFSAALRGKKRIVKLRIPGHQLAQVLVQQTARAALNIGANVPDPEPEKPPADLVDNADDDDVLLRSDIPVKKPKPSGQSLYEKAVQSGAIITSVTKKARVPVEKDDSYSYRERVRLPNGKRVTAMSTTTVQKSKRRGPAKIYEEVDVGSSDDEQSGDDPEDADFGSRARATNKDNRRVAFSAINQVSAEDSARKERLSLPGNLHAAGQREEDDNSELPDELPDDNLAGSHRPKPPLHTATSSKTAGKRPSMRPAHFPIATSTAATDDDDDDDENLDNDTDIDSFVARAASGQFGDETMPTSFNGASSTSKPRGRPRNKPSKTLGPKSSASSKAKAPPATFQHETQVISDGGESSDGLEDMFEDNNLSIEEQNRLAKLQVLQEMS
jgi:hypothetical protein